MNVKFPCSYNNYVKPHFEVYVIEKVSWIAKDFIKKPYANTVHMRKKWLAWEFKQALQNKQLAGVNVIVSGRAPSKPQQCKRKMGLVKPLWRSVQHEEHVTTVTAVSQSFCHYIKRQEATEPKECLLKYLSLRES